VLSLTADCLHKLARTVKNGNSDEDPDRDGQLQLRRLQLWRVVMPAFHAGATTRIAPGTTVAVNGVSPSSSPSNCTGSGAVLATVISRPRA
jgi:hypothetical protein